MNQIAIFASGTGTNSTNIIKYFKGHQSIKVSLLLSNNTNSLALSKAIDMGIKTITFNRTQFYNGDFVLQKLKENNIDTIILAGFIWIVPELLIENYTHRIINIHPSLLPKHGGKGMYGMNVHRSVKSSGDSETGITIHLVDGEYDNGEILSQVRCDVSKNDSPESISNKVHRLEYDNFPKEIERFILNSI